MIRRGDVRWFRFSSPDKRRPVLVLGRNDTSSLGQIPITVHATVHPIDRRHVQLKLCASWGGNGVNSGAPCRTRSVVRGSHRGVARSTRTAPRFAPRAASAVRFTDEALTARAAS